MTLRDDDLAHRFRQAERQTLRDRPPEKRHKWQKTRCPKCGYEIKFEPKPGFKGNFHCPTCGHDFKIPVLTDYVEEEELR